MSEQTGFDSNSEQTHNGERKGAEKDFSMQLQERLQMLAERNDNASFEVGYATHFEDDPEGIAFEVSLDQQPGRKSQDIRFSYGGVHGSLAGFDGAITDISSSTYNDPEAHLVDWPKIANNDEVPMATREIAKRMHELTSNPDAAKPIDADNLTILTRAIWDTTKELDGPIIYSTFRKYNTVQGKVSVNAYGDMARAEGSYLPDDKKPGQFVSIHAPEFSFYREVRGGIVSETYSESIDSDTLPPLTEEERKNHPYVVITAEQGRPHRDDDEVSFDENGKPATLQDPSDGYMVISANLAGAITMTMRTWHKTREEAQERADIMYASELAEKRTNPHDITPERQKLVLDALDAALLASELEGA